MEDDIFEIEKIIDTSVTQGIRYYFVCWKGYSEQDNTWEPEENLNDCEDVLQTFWKGVKKQKTKKVRKRKCDVSPSPTYGSKKKKRGRKSKAENSVKHDEECVLAENDTKNTEAAVETLNDETDLKKSVSYESDHDRGNLENVCEKDDETLDLSHTEELSTVDKVPLSVTLLQNIHVSSQEYADKEKLTRSCENQDNDNVVDPCDQGDTSCDADLSRLALSICEERHKGLSDKGRDVSETTQGFEKLSQKPVLEEAEGSTDSGKSVVKIDTLLSIEVGDKGSIRKSPDLNTSDLHAEADISEVQREDCQDSMEEEDIFELELSASETEDDKNCQEEANSLVVGKTDSPEIDTSITFIQDKDVALISCSDRTVLDKVESCLIDAVENQEFVCKQKGTLLNQETELRPTVETDLASTLETEVTPMGTGVTPTVETELTPSILEKELTPTVKTKLTPAVETELTPVETGLTPTVETGFTPTLESEVTPTVKIKFTPTVETGVTPTLESEVTPTVETGVTPTLESEVTPTVETGVTPTVKTKLTPTVETGLMPTVETGLTPTVETGVTPTVETGLTPTLESDVTPTMETGVTPTVETGVTPTVKTKLTPTVETGVTPTVEAGLTPTVETGLTPTVETGVTPTLESEVTPTVETGLTPTVETGVTPMETKCTPTVETELVPTLETELVPTTETGLPSTLETGLTPTVETGVTPTVETGVTPTVETGVTPTVETEVTPTVEKGVTPTVETEVTPTVEKGVTPTVETGLTPTVETGVTPTVETGLTPTVETGVTPVETEVTPTVETGVTPTVETDFTPMERGPPPTSETELIPTIETELAPTTEREFTSTIQTGSPSTLETKMAPTVETEVAPTMETGLTPTIMETEVTPTVDIAPPPTCTIDTDLTPPTTQGLTNNLNEACEMGENNAHGKKMSVDRVIEHCKPNTCISRIFDNLQKIKKKIILKPNLFAEPKLKTKVSKIEIHPESSSPTNKSDSPETLEKSGVDNLTLQSDSLSPVREGCLAPENFGEPLLPATAEKLSMENMVQSSSGSISQLHIVAENLSTEDTEKHCLGVSEKDVSERKFPEQKSSLEFQNSCETDHTQTGKQPLVISISDSESTDEEQIKKRKRLKTSTHSKHLSTKAKGSHHKGKKESRSSTTSRHKKNSSKKPENAKFNSVATCDVVSDIINSSSLKTSKVDRKNVQESAGKNGEFERHESDMDICESDFEFDLDDYNPVELINDKPSKLKKDLPTQIGIPLAISLRDVKKAIRRGDSSTILAALAGGLDIESPDVVTGMTLLMRAVSISYDSIVKLLINHGANVNAKDNSGSTPLMLACEQGFESTASLLMDAEADVNAKTISGETALIKACKKGFTDVTTLLLAHGADCQMRSLQSGWTASQWAQHCGHFEIFDLLVAHNKKLQSCAEKAIITCLGHSRSLISPPLLPYVCLYPNEDQKFTYHFNCSNLLLGKTVLLFCFRAVFSRSGEVDLSFSKDNGVHTITLNGVLQRPVLKNNRSVFKVHPKQDTNRLVLQTYQSHVHLLVCIYAADLDGDFLKIEHSSVMV